MRKHIKECQKICGSAGLSVIGIEYLGKHLAIVCVEGTVVMPRTPSDYRWTYNARSVARGLRASF
jgi:hypothetical protein